MGSSKRLPDELAHGSRARIDSSLTHRPRAWSIAWLIVAIATFVPFLPVIWNGFVDLDDADNIVGNPWLRGLASSNLRWMTTTFHLGHWQPLSWLSLTFDALLWGPRMDRGVHLTSAVLHATNALLLAMLGARLLAHAGVPPRERTIAAALGALVWGMHPQRVESVAWATERRDVLSGFFLLLVGIAYVPSVGRRRHLPAAIGLTACALASKASTMVLPALLLILDVYPLQRSIAERRLWMEKLPMVLLCGVSAMIALVASRVSGALQSFDAVSLGQRTGAAMFQLGFYVWKFVWPSSLLPLYEYPLDMGPLQPSALAGLGTFLFLLALAWRLRRRAPGFCTALAVYTVALAPTLGIAQSGPQVAADRYSYVAMMGWSLAAGAWAVRQTEQLRLRTVGLGLLLTVAGLLTWRQCGYWRDAGTLWAHVLAVRPDHAFAHKSLGDAARLRGDLPEAEAAYRRSLALRPLPEAYANLGSTLAAAGRYEEAFGYYRTAVALNPRYAFAWTSYGVALDEAGRPQEALEAHRRALGVDPNLMEAHVNLGSLLDDLGRHDEAIAEYHQALAIMPSVEAYNDLGVVLLKLGKPREAADQLRLGIALRAGVPAVLHENLGFALRATGDATGARAAFHEALRLDPNLPMSRAALAELDATAPPAP